MCAYEVVTAAADGLCSAMGSMLDQGRRKKWEMVYQEFEPAPITVRGEQFTIQSQR